MRRLSTLCAVLTLLLLAGHAAGQAEYTVAEIEPLPGHSRTSANAINAAGEVVGVSFGSPVDDQEPYIFSSAGGVRPLPRPAGYAYSVPTDINDEGVIVGFAQRTWSDESNPVGWRLEGGQLTLFPPLTHPEAINNAGLVVGRSCLSGLNLTCYFEAGPAVPFRTFGTATGYVSTMWRTIDVNSSGQMAAGGAWMPEARRREVDGTLIPLPGPVAPYVTMMIRQINDPGRVIGRWLYSTSSGSSRRTYSRGFIWSPETGAVEIGLPGGSVRPQGLNNLGVAVGETGGHENSIGAGWVWDEQRGARSLAPLVDPAWQLGITGISGINDAGQIIGTGTTQNIPSRSLTFVLTPAAVACEPPTFTYGPVMTALNPPETVFETAARGTPDLAFQWRRDGVPVVESNRMYGTRTRAMVITETTAEDAGVYDVVVTNACGELVGPPLVLGGAARCVADLDDGSGAGQPDGAVTIDDLIYYLGIFESGSMSADVDNGSGSGTPDRGVTVDDLIYLLTRFEAGC